MFEGEFTHTNVNREDRIADVGGRLSRSTRCAVYQLLKAKTYAKDLSRDTWEFAVTIGELRRFGASENESRWLVGRGYIEHAEEVPTRGNERAFDRHASLRFGKRSAFVITSAGVEFSRDFLNCSTHGEVGDEVDTNSVVVAPRGVRLQSAGNSNHSTNGNGNGHPMWDRDRRELRLGNKLIKAFKLPSPLQEAILMAFEEEHWPPRIDDPLPTHPELLPKRRLHDTIKSLNRNQKNCLIRFMGDGTGEGIRWELSLTTKDVEHSNSDPHLGHGNGLSK